MDRVLIDILIITCVIKLISRNLENITEKSVFDLSIREIVIILHPPK